MKILISENVLLEVIEETPFIKGFELTKRE